MRRALLSKFCAVVALALFAVPLFAHGAKSGKSATLPITTSSVKARELYVKGMEDYENLYLERSNDDWRAAVKEDPNLAVAWAWIAFNSGNPQEVSGARAKAKDLVPKATSGEQLMVAWIVKVQEGDFLGGITAMNDMLAMYPRDKHLLYLAGNWLMGENGNDQAQRFFEKALAIDKNYPAALNDLAYVEARNREFSKAFEAMDRYVALLPKEPNPQDSYGELKRMAGDFESSLVHYRAALKIDPDFVTAQLGLGDTYALMGNQEQARIEYDKAIRFAHNEADRLTYAMQKAMTYVRDGNFTEADKEFQQIAQAGSRQESGPAGSSSATPLGGISGGRQHCPEASETCRGGARPSFDHLRVRPRGGTLAHSPQPRRSRRACRESSAGGEVPAASGSHGQRQPQPRDPKLIQWRRRNAPDGREEVRRCHRAPGGG